MRNLSTIWFVVKIVFLVLDVLLLGIFIFALNKSWQFRPKLKPFLKKPKKVPVFNTEIFKEHWNNILESLKTDTPEARKFAIIAADALVDDVLKNLGYKGESTSDRLAQLSSYGFPLAEKLLQAHRIRNELAHTPGFDITPQDARVLIEIYEKFLKEVGVLN